MDSLRDYAAWIVGALSSGGMLFLVSLIKQRTWADWQKTLLSLALALVFGLLTAFVNGDVDPANIGTATAAIFTAATIAFKTYFQDTPANASLEQRKVL
jgi:hypothetical protein